MAHALKPLKVKWIIIIIIKNDSDYLSATEKGTQNVAMFLRSVPNWEIVEHLPDIGELKWHR